MTTIGIQNIAASSAQFRTDVSRSTQGNSADATRGQLNTPQEQSASARAASERNTTSITGGSDSKANVRRSEKSVVSAFRPQKLDDDDRENESQEDIPRNSLNPNSGKRLNLKA